jgi:hypothetical protein
MNYNFFVFKFLLFIIINFLFIFQTFFSLNFFFSSKIDEELIICFAIFFVFVLFINHIVNGLQDMLKARVEIYLNVFLIVFKLLKKSFKRLKKHNVKTNVARNFVFNSIWTAFFQNLSSFLNYQASISNYLIQLRLKTVTDSIIADLELKNGSWKRALVNAYLMEIQYFFFIGFLSKK